MAQPILYGPAYSTYVRTVRLAFQEKGVAYTLEEVDLMKGENQTPDYLALNPFGKVPAFVHDGFTLYETTAITRYVDEGFPGPKLQPADLRARARMAQIVAIVDAYVYPACIGKVVMQRLVAPLLGKAPDEAVIAEAQPMIEKSMRALEALVAEGPFLTGPEIGLADLHLVPVFGYFADTPEGKAALRAVPRLAA